MLYLTGGGKPQVGQKAPVMIKTAKVTYPAEKAGHLPEGIPYWYVFFFFPSLFRVPAPCGSGNHKNFGDWELLYYQEESAVTLREFFKKNPRGALAFSGGADSAFLLYEGVRLGAELRPYFIKTPFQPRFELEDARRFCGQLGVTLNVIESEIPDDSRIAANPPDRCYHCKRRLFSLLRDRAAADGFSLLLDGTNASDDGGDRPGMRALQELEVRSPLRECGLTKERIRALSKQAGLFTWDKPSYACLATRVPTGRPITRADLERIERDEERLSALGFRDFRLRLTAGGVRLQVLEGQLPLVLERRTHILAALSPDFSEITLDLLPRAAMD